MSYLH